MTIKPSLAAPLLDEDGLVRDFSSWSEELAAELAREAGVGELSEKHRHFIHALRLEYQHSNAHPSIPHVCHQLGIDQSDVDALFGCSLTAWRVAGLPNPGEEAKAYLGSM